MSARRRRSGSSCGIAAILLILFVLLFVAILLVGVPYLAYQNFGDSSSSLTFLQRWQYSAQVYLNKDTLQTPLIPNASGVTFTIQQGESINEIALGMESAGLIADAGAFRSYLIYKGYDTEIKAGDHQISAGMSPVSIAEIIKSVYSDVVSFVILPGWRAEEIAAALPTSGIEVTPEDFLNVVKNPVGLSLGSYLPASVSLEGFLFPGEYKIKRTISAEELAMTFFRRFQAEVPPTIRDEFAAHGLSFYQGIILASIIQRETFADSERPQIASVFYNRLATGMKLETDPTVQYSLGYSAEWGNWWKSPLDAADLTINSPFNTYLINGLPPAPICSPSLAAIQAAAEPASTDYLYFRARCDGSGLHVFARTFDEHLANGCK